MSYITHTVFGCVLLWASFPAAADPTPIATCPFEITQSGLYQITQDLTCPGNGITITASDVKLFLDGHTLNGSGTGEFGVEVTGSNDSVLGRGTVTSFQFNISIVSFGSAPSFGNRLVDIVTEASRNEGITIQNSIQNLIIDCKAHGNGAAGIALIGGSNNTLISNTAIGNVDYGIDLYNSSNNNVVIANQTDTNTYYGIHAWTSSSSNILQANKARGNTGFDLADDNAACDANTWKSNSFDKVNQSCIH